MKNLFYLLLTLIISFGVFADDQEAEHTHENDYEEGCTNDLDDDMDGNVDGDDDDCSAVLALAKDNTILGDLKSVDVSGYLVWGVGIGLLSSVGSSGSSTGTATTD